MNSTQSKNTQQFAKSFLAILALSILWENWSAITPTTKYLERLTLDFRYKNIGSLNFPSDKIIFLDIDNYSLDTVNKSEGPWPWKRDIWHDTLKLLLLGEPKAILFDVLLTETDKENPESDKQLAFLVKEFTNTSVAMNFESTKGFRPDRLPASSNAFSIQIPGAISLKNSFSAFSSPYSPLWENVSNIHIVNSFKDTDGLFRSTPLFLSYDQNFYPALSLKAIQIFLDNPKLKMESNDLWIRGKNKYLKAPLSDKQQFQFHFYKNDFQKIPFQSMHSLSSRWKNSTVESNNLSRYMKTRFHNKIVIIGASATNLQDLKATPIDAAYSGALLHATAISNILEGHYLLQPFLDWQIFASLILVTLIYLNFIYVQNLLFKNILPMIILVAYSSLSFYFFYVDGLDLPLSGPILLGLLSYSFGLIHTSRLLLLMQTVKTHATQPVHRWTNQA